MAAAKGVAVTLNLVVFVARPSRRAPTARDVVCRGCGASVASSPSSPRPHRRRPEAGAGLSRRRQRDARLGQGGDRQDQPRRARPARALLPLQRRLPRRRQTVDRRGLPRRPRSPPRGPVFRGERPPRRPPRRARPRLLHPAPRPPRQAPRRPHLRLRPGPRRPRRPRPPRPRRPRRPLRRRSSAAARAGTRHVCQLPPPRGGARRGPSRSARPGDVGLRRRPGRVDGVVVDAWRRGAAGHRAASLSPGPRGARDGAGRAAPRPRASAS